jgi:hypothetical protein
MEIYSRQPLREVSNLKKSQLEMLGGRALLNAYDFPLVIRALFFLIWSPNQTTNHATVPGYRQSEMQELMELLELFFTLVLGSNLQH